MIALAHLGIMPPKTLPDRPPQAIRGEADAHMVRVRGTDLACSGREDGLLCLNSFGDERLIALGQLPVGSLLRTA